MGCLVLVPNEAIKYSCFHKHLRYIDIYYIIIVIIIVIYLHFRIDKNKMRDRIEEFFPLLSQPAMEEGVVVLSSQSSSLPVLNSQ